MLKHHIDYDLIRAEFLDSVFVRILHPLVFGDYPETMKTNVGSRLPAFTEEESEQVKGAFDFVGVINYMALYVKDNSSSLKPNLQDFNTDIAVEMTCKLYDTV